MTKKAKFKIRSMIGSKKTTTEVFLLVAFDGLLGF